MKFFAPLVLIMLLLSGCKNDLTKETALLGTWRLYDIERTGTKAKESDAFDKDAALNKLVQDGAVLNFFEDNTYTDLRGKEGYITGKWKFSAQNKSLSFIDAEEATEPVKIKIEKNNNGKEVLTISAESQQVELKFIKESVPLKEFKSDPFYPANNTLRLKPKKEEEPAALKRRLMNYFKHMALILKAATERKQDVVSFGFSMGPVKIYNGGIGIQPYSIVPESWKNCFYDEADASTAYRKFETYLQKSSYSGAGTGNWFEDDYNILLTIYSGIGQDEK